MAITPSGIPYAETREEMVVLVDLADGSWPGDWRPSGERSLHRAIYGARPEAGAIVHTHQSAASACAAARVGLDLPSGEARCAAYALPGTRALAKATVAALGDRGVVLLANHGALAVGEYLDEAFARARELESAAAAFLAARAGAELPAPADAAWDPRLFRAMKLSGGEEAMVCASPYALTWARRLAPLPAYLDDFAQLVGRALPSRPEVPEALPPSGAVLVPGLGSLVRGPDAEALAMVIEKEARAAICGEGIGGARKIPALEALLMRAVYRQSYAKRAKRAREG
jgi:L-fuculose-phosphate aldolase